MNSDINKDKIKHKQKIFRNTEKKKLTKPALEVQIETYSSLGKCPCSTIPKVGPLT